MASLVYYVGVSLDGFVAGPAGQTDFYPLSADHLAHMQESMPEVLPTHVRRELGCDSAPNQRFGTVVMGRGTYAPALAAGIGDPYAHLRTVVVSRDPQASSDPSVQVSPDPVGLVRDLRRTAGQDVWLAGGGRLAGALAGEVDELVLKVYPVVAGTGVPVMAGGFDPAPFVPVGEVRFESGCVERTYRRAAR